MSGSARAPSDGRDGSPGAAGREALAPGTPGFRLAIFLLSLGAIVLEISFTRVFSYKLYYYFTYLVLGLALLGLGSGGVFVATLDRLRSARPERVVALCALLAGLAVPASYAVVAGVQLNTIDLATQPVESLKLATLSFALFVPFLFVGVAIATIFASRPAEINRLYFADLVGAGLGCGLCVPLFGAIGPPRAILLGGVVLALSAASLRSPATHRSAWAGVVVAALMTPLVAIPGLLADPVPDRNKTMSPQNLGTRPSISRAGARCSGWTWCGMTRRSTISSTTASGERSSTASTATSRRCGRSTAACVLCVIEKSGADPQENAYGQFLSHKAANCTRVDVLDALDKMVDGFAMFDADDRLVFCNEKYQD